MELSIRTFLDIDVSNEEQVSVNAKDLKNLLYKLEKIKLENERLSSENYRMATKINKLEDRLLSYKSVVEKLTSYSKKLEKENLTDLLKVDIRV